MIEGNASVDGVEICVNSDDDNENGLPDLLEAPLDPLMDDDDLEPVTLTAGGRPGAGVAVSFPPIVQLWGKRDKSEPPDIPAVIPESGSFTKTVYVEGLERGEGEISIAIASCADPADCTGDPNDCQCQSNAGSCYDSAPLRVNGGRMQVSFSKPALPADGESHTQAGVSGQDPESTITYSIVGDAHGALINPSTGQVTAGDCPAVITVRATDEHGCHADGRLPIGCGCEFAGCGFGDGRAFLGSVDLRFGLGRMAYGKSAGAVLLSAPALHRYVATAAALRYDVADSDQIDVVRTATALRQVRVPEGLADVAQEGTSGPVVLSFYKTGDFALVGDEYVPLSNAVPLWQWSIARTAGGPGGPQLIAEQWADGHVSKRFVYTQSFGSNPPGVVWTLESGNATTVDLTETEHWDAAHLTRIYEMSRLGGVYFRARETFRLLNGGRAIAEQVLAPGGAEITTTYSYYEPGAGPAGRLDSVVSSEGAWERRQYDAYGRVTGIISGWNDKPFPASFDATHARATILSYDPTNPSDARPWSIVERIEGTAVARTDFTHDVEGGHPVTYEKRSLNPQSGGGPYLITRTVRRSDDDDRVLEIVNPDQTLVRANSAVEKGDYNANSSPPFTPNSGGEFERVTVTRGTVAAPDGIALKTTQTASVIDAIGRTVYEEQRACASPGGSYPVVDWRKLRYDDRGRLVQVDSANGASGSAEWGNCCGMTAVTDAVGTRTEFIRDALGRVVQEIKKGVGGATPQPDLVTEFDRGVAGIPGLLRTTIRAASGQPALGVSSLRDLAGRVVAVADEAGLSTCYEYNVSTTGNRVVTVTRPDGVKQETEYYLDGSVKKLTQIDRQGVRTQLALVNYAAASGEQSVTAYVGPDGADSLNRASAIYDAVGRAKQVTRPAFESSTPVITTYAYDENNGGRIVRSQESFNGTLLRAARLYEYDATGAATRVGLDLGGSANALDNAGPDRIAETLSQFVQRGSDWWLESESRVYRDGQSTPTIVGKQRRRLTGLAGGTLAETQVEDFFGNVTASTLVVTPSQKDARQVTTFTGTTNTAEAVVLNGLVQSVRDKAQLTTQFAYDALGRRTRLTDSRGNWSETHYDASNGRLTSVEDIAGAATIYGYFAPNDAHPGQLKSIQNAAGKFTYIDYDDLGRLSRVWGHVPQPAAVGYDALGRRVSLSTFRVGPAENVDWTQPTWPANASPSNPAVADITSWDYDPVSGLPRRKTYADGTHVDLTYTPDGRVRTRAWARLYNSSPLLTTYSYYDSPADGAAFTGQLKRIDYADDTPDIEFTYERLGRVRTVIDGVGQRQFDYAASGAPLDESFLSGLLAGKKVRTQYEHTVGQHTFARLATLSVGTASDPAADYAATYDYDVNTDRLTAVTGPGLPSGGAHYTYRTDSDLLRLTEFKDGGTVIASTERTYEPQRDLLTSVENRWLGASPSPYLASRYAYSNDVVGRRMDVVRTGQAFQLSGSNDHLDIWQYNDRSELTGSRRYLGTSPDQPGSELPDLKRLYEYDPIGNRISSVTGADPPTSYARNRLNQYDPVETASSPPIAQRLKYDPDGNLTEALVSGDTDGDGDVDQDDIDRVLFAYGTCEGDPDYDPGANVSTDSTCGSDPALQTINQDDIDVILYYYGLQATSTLRARLTWDAENRLTGWEPLAFVPGARKVQFSYDYLGRRVEKRVYEYGGGGWTLHETRRVVYWGWLPLLELECGAGVPPVCSVVKQYTWGLDLAQSLGAAGGIGGLLACRDPNDPADPDDPYGDFVYFYDANGNVTQLLGVSASAGFGHLAARYEYDPYGNLLLDPSNPSYSGAYAPFNALRFSTKPFDEETTFGNWGRRYFGPTLGRWGSKDPIGELGGLGLYRYSLNRPTGAIDALGLLAQDDCGDSPFGLLGELLDPRKWAFRRPDDPPVTDASDPAAQYLDLMLERLMAAARPVAPYVETAERYAGPVTRATVSTSFAVAAIGMAPGTGGGSWALYALVVGVNADSAIADFRSLLSGGDEVPTLLRQGLYSITQDESQAAAGEFIINIALPNPRNCERFACCKPSDLDEMVRFFERFSGPFSGQVRVSPTFHRGGSLDELIEQISRGHMRPSDVEVPIFWHGPSRMVLPAGNRRQAVLWGAGHHPQSVIAIAPTPAMLDRLNDIPLSGFALPGSHYPVTRGSEILRVIERPASLEDCMIRCRITQGWMKHERPW